MSPNRIQFQRGGCNLDNWEILALFNQSKQLAAGWYHASIVGPFSVNTPGSLWLDVQLCFCEVTTTIFLAESWCFVPFVSFPEETGLGQKRFIICEKMVMSYDLFVGFLT